jgi:N,N-dimethylformamidase
MKLVGYSDRWSVRRGESIRFFVSSVYDQYTARLVRLIHGDENPRGPGFKSMALESEANGSYRGLRQDINTGSYVYIEPHDTADLENGFTAIVWLQATLPEAGTQGIFSQTAAGGEGGFCLFLDGQSGKLTCRLEQQRSSPAIVRSEYALRRGAWYFVALSYDASERALVMRIENTQPSVMDRAIEMVQVALTAPAKFSHEAPLLIGARAVVESAGRRRATVS